MSRAGEPGARAGFTLIELLVVLLVIGLALGAALPFLARGPGRADLDAAARGLIGELRAARAEAIRANAEVLVVIEPETRTVRTAGVEGSTNFPPDVTVSAVGARSEMPGEGAVGIRFFPDGGSTGGSVTLARGDAESRRVAVDWLTGRVRVEP